MIHPNPYKRNLIKKDARKFTKKSTIDSSDYHDYDDYSDYENAQRLWRLSTIDYLSC